MVRKFWWGGLDDKRKLCLKAWDSLCKPKCSSGLGFRRFKDVNKVVLESLYRGITSLGPINQIKNILEVD